MKKTEKLTPIPTTNARGKALLLKIRDEILAEPARLRMGLWTANATVLPYGEKDKPACGTVGCIAGWAVLMTTKKPVGATTHEGHKKFLDKIYGSGLETPDSVEVRAKELLKLDEDAADGLFYPDRWPEEYYGLYDAARSPSERAFIVGAVIERCISDNFPTERKKKK